MHQSKSSTCLYSSIQLGHEVTLCKRTLAYSVTQYGWCPYAVSNIETVYSANV
jgi:hypothetical protein